MNVVLTGSDVDIVQKALEMYIALHLGRYRDISNLYRFRCESDQYEEAIAYEQGRENIDAEMQRRLEWAERMRQNKGQQESGHE